MKKYIRIVFKSCLFISSYIPLFILILIQQMESLSKDSFINMYNDNKKIFYVISIISIISLIQLKILFIGNYTKKITFNDVSSINDDTLNYFITYIIPLLSINIKSDVSILINITMFLIIGTYYVSSNLIYLNVLLIFAGYKVFKDKNNNIIISKRSIDFLNMNNNILCKKIGNSKIYIVK